MKRARILIADDHDIRMEPDEFVEERPRVTVPTTSNSGSSNTLNASSSSRWWPASGIS